MKMSCLEGDSVHSRLSDSFWGFPNKAHVVQLTFQFTFVQLVQGNQGSTGVKDVKGIVETTL